MNAGTFNNVCHSLISKIKSDDSSIKNQNNNACKQKKKLSLTDELLGDILQFKRFIMSQKNKHHKINVLDPDSNKCEYPGSDHDEACTDTAIDVRERAHQQRCLEKLINYLNGLQELNRSKGEHLENLERFLAEEDRVIDALRTDVETANAEYETRKRTFFESFRDAEFVQYVLFEAVRKFQAVCAKQGPEIASRDSAAGVIVNGLRDDLDALAADMERVRRSSTAADVVEIAVRRLDAAARPTQSPKPRDDEHFDNFPGLLRAIESMRENNRALETTADALDDEMAGLHASLSDVTAEYNALDADISDQKSKVIVLDDFCDVTEQIAAQHIRNMEFSRTLVADDKQIDEELKKIEQLKTKISRKKGKKVKILKETDLVKNQLDLYMNKYEELERRNAFLADDLMNVKLRSNSNFDDPSELQSIGSRTKHLQQLRIHYNKMANKRDALKSKLQKEQRVAKSFER